VSLRDRNKTGDAGFKSSRDSPTYFMMTEPHEKIIAPQDKIVDDWL